MKIETRFHGDVCIIAVHGKMMGGPESSKLYDEVKSHLSNESLKFIIDMKHVKWLNSGGIGVLMSVFTTVHNSGGSICLADLSEEARSLFTLTKLINVFKINKNMEEALKDLVGND